MVDLIYYLRISVCRGTSSVGWIHGMTVDPDQDLPFRNRKRPFWGGIREGEEREEGTTNRIVVSSMKICGNKGFASARHVAGSD